ncbi:Nucleotidylyl transferase [Hypoxylon sp. FL1857]|nr:Nucleotidylyl transferase [Hypoxylon sp. FL1857]
MTSLQSDSSSMARPLAPSLSSFFTSALRHYELSNTTFRVLCSLNPSSLPSPPPEELPAPQPPSTSLKELLVLDSSFNPPTLAHQRMALSALSDHSQSGNEGSYKSRVLLLLAINNADKPPKPVGFPQRLAMMYIFARDILRSASRTPESKRGCEGVDIAVTTEPYFHAKSSAVAESEFYRGAAPVEQVYLTGFDTLIRIFNPKYYPNDSMARVLDPFFAHSRLRVTMRPDAEWGGAAEQLAYLEGLRRGELERVGGRTEWVRRIEMVEGAKDGEEVVSSTKVRNAVLREDWDALKKLVSEDVASYIREKGLYTQPEGAS